ncbi:segregation/condensation protein A [Patescibacteria group bacterium]|nr:segregation/condensation protein A [Patescibacteria group bacterium]
MNSFTVTTETFSGPIDALLHMIERRKMPINDISLTDITDEYIQFVNTLDSEHLAGKTHFIWVAATLILIKSKSLLPTLELTEDEEEDIIELKRRIALLNQFQEIGKGIGSQFHLQPHFYYPQTPKQLISFRPHTSITRITLKENLMSVLEEIPVPEVKKQEGYVKIAVHIDGMMKSLEERIMKAIRGDFNSFITDQIGNHREPKQIRVYKVVGFLAMLELVKKGALAVVQEKNFSNIHIEKI